MDDGKLALRGALRRAALQPRRQAPDALTGERRPPNTTLVPKSSVLKNRDGGSNSDPEWIADALGETLRALEELPFRVVEDIARFREGAGDLHAAAHESLISQTGSPGDPHRGPELISRAHKHFAADHTLPGGFAPLREISTASVRSTALPPHEGRRAAHRYRREAGKRGKQHGTGLHYYQ